ncbi:hypothetical protein THAOC_09197, partial [Thalassiosira oceanica]
MMIINEDASKLITKLARLTAKTDFGKSMSPLVTHSRKGGAFPIMQSKPSAQDAYQTAEDDHSKHRSRPKASMSGYAGGGRTLSPRDMVSRAYFCEPFFRGPSRTALPARAHPYPHTPPDPSPCQSRTATAPCPSPAHSTPRPPPPPPPSERLSYHVIVQPNQTQTSGPVGCTARSQFSPPPPYGASKQAPAPVLSRPTAPVKRHPPKSPSADPPTSPLASLAASLAQPP